MIHIHPTSPTQQSSSSDYAAAEICPQIFDCLLHLRAKTQQSPRPTPLSTGTLAKKAHPLLMRRQSLQHDVERYAIVATRAEQWCGGIRPGEKQGVSVSKQQGCKVRLAIGMA
jgi:hypothetical protein